MRRIIVASIAAALLLTTPAGAAAEDGRLLTGYKLTTWNHIFGLSHDDVVHAVAQDRDGYLWIGTNDGLARFDGARFLKSEALTRSPIPAGVVQLLCASKDGSLWVTIRQQNRTVAISRIDGTGVRTYGAADGARIDTTTALFEDADGTMWVGGDSGLFELAGDRWTPRDGDGTLRGGVLAGYASAHGVIVATSRGVFERLRGARAFQRIDNTPADRAANAANTALGRETRAIVVGDRDAAFVTDPLTGFRALGSAAPHLRQRALGYRLLYDRRGNLWVGTYGQGLWRVRDGGSAGYVIDDASEMTGLASDGVMSMAEDRDGTIWVGTTAGLCRLTRQDIGQVRGLGPVRAVAAAGTTLWVGTTDELVQFRAGSTSPSAQRISLSPARLMALNVDDTGTLWVTTDQYVGRLRHSEIERVGVDMQKTPWLASDARGGHWFIDPEHHLVKRSGDGASSVALPAGLKPGSIVAAYGDMRGRLWASFRNGHVAIFDPANERAPRDLHLDVGVCRAFYEDAEHVMWLGCAGGLARVSDHGSATIPTSDGFPGEIAAISEDDAGCLWLAVISSGITRVPKTELDRAIALTDYHPLYTAYRREDGLAGVPSSYGNGLRAARAADGQLWFVTGSGVTIVDPTIATSARRQHLARIEELVVNNTRFAPAGTLVLPRRTSTVEVDYTTLNLTSPFRSQFKYRLDGVDDKWIDAGTRQEAFYTNLRPGKYRFSVISSDDQRLWSSPPASVAFEIEPTFYQTTAFLIACGAAGTMTVWLLWILRERRLRKVFSLVIAERLRLSREMHDTLLQGLVSVALQFEAIANEPTKVSAAATDQIRGIRRRIEECIRDVRQGISDLRESPAPASDLVAALNANAAAASAGASLKIDVAVEGQLRPCSPEVQGQVVKIAREAIMNSVRHARATRIRMDLLYEKALLKLRISDDGVGFDPVSVTVAESHYGLVGMRERAESVGGSLHVASRAGSGTSIEICVPLGKASRTGA